MIFKIYIIIVCICNLFNDQKPSSADLDFNFAVFGTYIQWNACKTKSIIIITKLNMYILNTYEYISCTYIPFLGSIRDDTIKKGDDGEGGCFIPRPQHPLKTDMHRGGGGHFVFSTSATTHPDKGLVRYKDN